MQTVVDDLERRAEELLGVIDELLRHSGLHVAIPRGSMIISTNGDMGWDKLDVEARQLQARALRDYERFHSLCSILLLSVSTDGREALKDADDEVREAIDQHGLTWSKTTTEVYDKVANRLLSVVKTLRGLYDASRGAALFVPDTNALLANVDLETWRFPDISPFVLMLTPTVLAELDSLKINHRNEVVREKSEGLITRIKGYRARGNLLDGVPLKRGVSELRSIAVEPDMNETLPWLDPANDDDRFIASVIEVMRQHPHSPVALVTRDINMQNKAAFASLPFFEPPTAAKSSKQSKG